MSSARSGALLWFNSVLPSLLPFMIGTNLLLRFGVVDFLGTLLEPVMKPLFGVSGKGAFAFVMGATSGYPIGAQICANLRESGKISQIETQRLLSFVNNSGPLFMIGAVGVGMFGNERIGYFILITNLAGAVLTGMLFKFYKRKDREIPIPIKDSAVKSRVYDQPFGKILSDSVWAALESLLKIAGFIILFSVLLKILEIIGFIKKSAEFLLNLGIPFNREIIESSLYGFIEITNGTNSLSALGTDRSVIILCAALVAFGGMSIFSQSIAFLSKTDINPLIYFISKLLNAVLTAAAGFFLYPLFNFESPILDSAVPVFAPGPVDRLLLSTIICAMMLFTILVTCFAVKIGQYIKK
ncbi:MAG: hypothetical protein FWE24_08995 [Defluviitaleaceae bacterium]|nr:hypothetical protein [Defluviitaleaceae bacterium]